MEAKKKILGVLISNFKSFFAVLLEGAIAFLIFLKGENCKKSLKNPGLFKSMF